MALVHHRNIPFFTSWDALAKYELKNYWEDGCTVECRYFYLKKMQKILLNKRGTQTIRLSLTKDSFGTKLVVLITEQQKTKEYERVT